MIIRSGSVINVVMRLFVMPNPYHPPPSSDESPERELLKSERWTRKRKVAALLLATPVLLAIPIRYWAFNHAGSWFVSTDLAPEHRTVVLGFSYLMLMFCIFSFCVFPAFTLLWADRVKPMLTGSLAIICGMLLLPALVLTWILVSCYIEFG